MKHLLILFFIFINTSLFSQTRKFQFYTDFTYSRPINMSYQGESVDINDSKSYGINMLMSYNLSTNMSLGLGIGLQGYEGPILNTMPIYVNFKYYFTPFNDSFFITTDIGQSGISEASDTFKYGLLVNGGLGYVFYSGRRKLFLTLNYGYKKLKTSSDYDWVRKYQLHEIKLSIGYGF